MSVFLQTVRGYSAIETGLILTPATIGILVSSMGSGRLAKRFPQAVIIRAGFVPHRSPGVVLLLALADMRPRTLDRLAPGLLLVGLGVGAMLTSSVNVVQSSFPEATGRDLRALAERLEPGSSFGVAIAGSVIVSSLVTGNEGYAAALVVLIAFGAVGLVAALLLRPEQVPAAER